MQIDYYFHSEIGDLDKQKAQEYLADKISNWVKILTKSQYSPKARFELEFMSRKKHYRTELQLESSLGNFMAVAKTHTIEEGIDSVISEIKRQIAKQKDRAITLRRRGGASLKKRFSIAKEARFRLPKK